MSGRDNEFGFEMPACSIYYTSSYTYLVTKGKSYCTACVYYGYVNYNISSIDILVYKSFSLCSRLYSDIS